MQYYDFKKIFLCICTFIYQYFILNILLIFLAMQEILNNIDWDEKKRIERNYLVNGGKHM